MSTDLLGLFITGPADLHELASVRAWRQSLSHVQYARTRRVPLDDVAGWATGSELPALRHNTSRFFSVIGVEVQPPAPEPSWTQPMIDQPEIGLLGIAITPTERGYAALIQAKAEPGNVNGIQLSPTVQATRSNSLRVHGGRAVPYLDLFTDSDAVLVDTRQSEHGAVFWRKRNRVMVVNTPALTPLPGFRWIEMADLLGLLPDDDLVHADTRAVLACMPWSVGGACSRHLGHSQLMRSLAPPSSDDVVRRLARWMSAERSSCSMSMRIVPLPDLVGWQRSTECLSRVDGRGLEIVAVDVEARGREVDKWSQPMVRPRGIGLIGLAVTTGEDQLMVLVRMCPEPGLVDGAELGPTVQLAGDSEPQSDAENRMYQLLTSVAAEATIFDAVLSDEGGRFLHGRHRHLVVTIDPVEPPPGYRWCRMAELMQLLIHSHQVNMQARSAFLCLLSTLCETRRG